MKGSKTMRVVLDVALTAMIVFEMLIQFTGEFLHEVVGFAFFATVALHLVLSAAWVKKTARNAKSGKLTRRRAALAVVGCLLAATTVVLGISSVAISGILASTGFAWPIGSYATWAVIHTLSAYALCALVVVHLAMHWAFLASAFRVPYSPSRRRAIATSVNAVAALGVVALGLTAAGKTMPPASAGSGESSPTAEGAVGTRDFNGDVSDALVTELPDGGTSGSHKSQSVGSASSAETATPAAETASSGETSATTAETTTVSGICTLCRKQCPLSAPKCDKPYEAGLI